MSIVFTCPHCQSQTEVPAEFAGRQGPCRVCGTIVSVPSGGQRRPSGIAKLSAIFQAGLVGGTFAAAVTLLLVTLPEIGSPLSVLRALVSGDPLEQDYRDTILSHVAFWGIVTVFGAAAAAALIAILASRENSASRFEENRRGAGWGCGVATALAGIVVLASIVLGTSFPSPTTTLARLFAILGAGFLGAVLGIVGVRFANRVSRRR